MVIDMPHKQTRRIIRIGTTSYGITIPISWLRYYNLGYGDSLEVESGEILKIKPMEK